MNKFTRITLFLIIIMAVELIGVAWAAASGVVTVGGTASLGGAVELRFIEVTDALNGMASGNTDAVISLNGQTLTIAAEFDSPSDVASFTFKLTNTGSSDIEIASLDLFTDTIGGMSGFSITSASDYRQLAGQTITRGSTTRAYTIALKPTGVAAGTETFTIAMDYFKAEEQ